MNFSLLQDIILYQRLNYCGSIPYVSESNFIEHLHEIVMEKHQTFLSLQSAKNQENDIHLTKDLLNKHIQILNDICNSCKSDEVKDKIQRWYQDKICIELQV